MGKNYLEKNIILCDLKQNKAKASIFSLPMINSEIEYPDCKVIKKIFGGILKKCYLPDGYFCKYQKKANISFQVNL